eukprot:1161781-Pelagomonas_calceolata.AAC.4
MPAKAWSGCDGEVVMAKACARHHDKDNAEGMRRLRCLHATAQASTGSREEDKACGKNAQFKGTDCYGLNMQGKSMVRGTTEASQDAHSRDEHRVGGLTMVSHSLQAQNSKEALAYTGADQRRGSHLISTPPRQNKAWRKRQAGFVPASTDSGEISGAHSIPFLFGTSGHIIFEVQQSSIQPNPYPKILAATSAAFLSSP